MNNLYPNGNSMTFPLELAEIPEEADNTTMKYLYPLELCDLQGMVEETCNQMEYDGSMMYDLYPDKETVRRLSKCICKECCNRKEQGKPGQSMEQMVNVMLCHEMSCRRQQRRGHKRGMSR